jgi:hypothetical protein
MEQIFLAIVFIINGEAAFLPGWYPLEIESIERCETAAIMLERQAEMIFSDSDLEVAGIYCGTANEIQEKIKILDDIQV